MRSAVRRRQALILVVLGALSAFGPLSMDLYLPALPSLSRDLHSPEALGQWTMSACMIGLATGQLFAGPLSDRVGRRRPLLVGVALYAVLSVLCAVAPNVGALIGLRLLQGLAGAVGLVISRAMVRDMYAGSQIARIFSLLMLVTGVAPIAAPVLGGQLTKVLDWRGLFLILAGIGVVLTVAVAMVLPETLPPDRRHGGGMREVRQAFGEVSREPLFASCATVLAVGGAGMFTYISVSAFVLESGYGLSAQSFSFVFGINSAGLVLAGFINSRLVKRRQPAALLVGGLSLALVAAAVCLIAALADWPIGALLVALFVMVAASGLLMPNASALGLIKHKRNAGTASAIMGTGQFLVGALIAPVASIGGATATSMSTVMVLVLLLAWLVGVFGVRPAARGISGFVDEPPVAPVEVPVSTVSE